MKKFSWIKKGLLFQQGVQGLTHASHPVIIHYKDDIFILGFTSRNHESKSHIFICYVKIEEEQIIFLSEPKMILQPGDLGFFDCDGVISCCLVKNDGVCYLYYVGWQNLPNNMWICDTGRAIVDMDNLTAYKQFEGPIFGRDRNHPLFVAATAFYITPDKVWHTFYNSGIKWEIQGEQIKHYYGLHHATSIDGIDWVPDIDRKMCIPFKDEYEYAFGRPSIVFWDDKFHMWYAHRATKHIDAYRIGYSYSTDCVNWVRDDENSGIDVSEKGWDSEMICYPCVFDHAGNRFMLYNGNEYGRTGFGYAVLKYE